MKYDIVKKIEHNQMNSLLIKDNYTDSIRKKYRL